MSSSNTPARRDATLDVAKGLTIIAVVFVHVWRGADAAGLIADHVLFRVVDTAMYLWVMTLFAFVAGLFIERGMVRDGPGRYARARVLEFLWLYVLWSLLNNFSNLIGSRFANTPVGLEEALTLWEPRAQMWYLGWIGVMVAVAAAAQPWRSKKRTVITLVAAGAGSLACWGLNGPYLGMLGLGISVAFFAGIAAGPARTLRLLNATPAWRHAVIASTLMGITLSLVVFDLAVPPSSGGEDRTIATVLIGFAASAMSTVAALMIARLLAASPLRRGLAYLGAASMAVFLAHLLFTPMIRIVLSQLGMTDLTVHVLLGTIGGIAAPLLLAIVARRLGTPWLFARPRRRAAASAISEGRPELTRG